MKMSQIGDCTFVQSWNVLLRINQTTSVGCILISFMNNSFDRRNCRYWSDYDLRRIEEPHTKIPEKLD